MTIMRGSENSITIAQAMQTAPVILEQSLQQRLQLPITIQTSSFRAVKGARHIPIDPGKVRI